MADLFDAVYYAAQSGDNAQLKKLMQRGLLNIQRNGETPVARLLAEGKGYAAHRLLALGADANSSAPQTSVTAYRHSTTTVLSNVLKPTEVSHIPLFIAQSLPSEPVALSADMIPQKRRSRALVVAMMFSLIGAPKVQSSVADSKRPTSGDLRVGNLPGSDNHLGGGDKKAPFRFAFRSDLSAQVRKKADSQGMKQALRQGDLFDVDSDTLDSFNRSYGASSTLVPTVSSLEYKRQQALAALSRHGDTLALNGLAANIVPVEFWTRFFIGFIADQVAAKGNHQFSLSTQDQTPLSL